MSCLSCGAHTTEVLDLGRLRLPDFLEPDEPLGEAYPLRLVLCETCTLLQLGDLVPRDAVIHERYGFASGLNEANRTDLRQNAEYAMQWVSNPAKWLDIGCNDGTLLANVPPHIWRAGVEPIAAYAGPARQHADEIINDYFDPNCYAAGEFDVITATAMFYAIPDPTRFAEGVREVLARDGVFVIQQNYALDMLQSNVIDNVIHEHVAYYSVRSLHKLLSRCGLQIFDVTYSDPGIKGGCMRTAVCHTGARGINQSFVRALKAESAAGLTHPETWGSWGSYVLGQMSKTRSFLEGQKSVYCYGAGNRGGTLMQLIGAENIKLAVERAEWKVGKVWNSTGMLMISEEQFRRDHPDYLVISPWFFRKGFIERESAYLDSGGKMIFPLPHFEIVSGS
jgi:NDP-4-keto-2,6-dideoxyhexose 3-C-methyltransferase